MLLQEKAKVRLFKYAMLKSRKVQSILEYVVMFLVAITAMCIISHYVRNSLSGKFRETADVFGGGEVYAPGDTTVTE